MKSLAGVPPAWEVEFSVLDIVAEQTGIPRELVRPESRLLEDLHIDSLDLVELILALEQTFHVTIPDDASRLPFVSGAMTVGDLARIVRHQWGTGASAEERQSWFTSKPAPRPPFKTPFTQLGGRVKEKELRGAALHEPMTPTESGHLQYRRRTDGMRCVLVPGGDTEIGSDDFSALPDQQPLHHARLSPFLMDAEPVSTSAYARFLNSVRAPAEIVSRWCGVVADDRRGRHFQLKCDARSWLPRLGTQSQPMILVSWFGANAYSLWANRAEWRDFGDERRQARSFLPSEAQWEYAARGPKWQRYPWGDDPCGAERALVAMHTARQDYPGLLPLADVNTKLGESPFGLLHMAGNVWNWCRDWYAPSFYREPGARALDPVNTEPSVVRSERGGSWIGPAELAACSYRRGRPAFARGRCLGFRCAAPAENLSL